VTFLVWQLRIGACGVGACAFWPLWQLPIKIDAKICHTLRIKSLQYHSKFYRKYSRKFIILIRRQKLSKAFKPKFLNELWKWQWELYAGRPRRTTTSATPSEPAEPHLKDVFINSSGVRAAETVGSATAAPTLGRNAPRGGGGGLRWRASSWMGPYSKAGERDADLRKWGHLFIHQGLA